ncbi:MAG TPA: hypothetical protein VGB20_05235 [bacterium]
MPKRIITKRIGEVLIERTVITRQQLEQALAHQRGHGGMLGQILIQLGFANEAEIALALTAQYGFPYLPLENYEVDEDLMAVVPERVARQYCLIPVDRIGNALTLAMADPTNVQAIEDIEMLTKCVVQTFVSTPSEIKSAIQKYYKKPAAGGGADGGGAAAP